MCIVRDSAARPERRGDNGVGMPTERAIPRQLQAEGSATWSFIRKGDSYSLSAQLVRVLRVVTSHKATESAEAVILQGKLSRFGRAGLKA